MNGISSKKFLGIKEWNSSDRPREKMMEKGRNALSDAELLSILIGTGTRRHTALDLAKLILSDSLNQLSGLGKKEISDLVRIPGIGEAKAITIVAALELGRRRKDNQVQEKPKITCSKDAFDILYPLMEDQNHEEFWVLYLNRANKVIATRNISKGGISGTVADSRIIFKIAIELLSSAIILSHNHPSGNLKPSESDLQLTKKLKEAGNLLEIPVLDHLIIGESGYLSFADEGLI